MVQSTPVPTLSAVRQHQGRCSPATLRAPTPSREYWPPPYRQRDAEIHASGVPLLHHHLGARGSARPHKRRSSAGICGVGWKLSCGPYRLVAASPNGSAGVLPVVGLTWFNPGDLGDGVRLVGRLNVPSQQLAFRHRLPLASFG